VTTLVLLGAGLARPIIALGGDWPQILGPYRNGVGDDERLASQWPSGGLKTLWQRSVGKGFAGVAVAQARVILFHRVGDQELVEAMDATTGTQLWKIGFPTRFPGQIVTDGDDGPRCVPLIHRDRVYVFGAGGNLHCVSLATGEEHWSRALHQEFQVPESYFGVGSTPIVERDKLLVNLGAARSGAGLVAFALDTGKTLWQATDEQPSYSCPTAATIDGVRHVIFVTRLNVVSVDPDTGAVRFRFPFGQRGPTVNAATPLAIDGHVFVSASYGIGAVFAKIGKESSKTIWANDDVMSSQYSTCVYNDGHLYGIDGRQDSGVATLRCLNPRTGKVNWMEKGFGMATPILADGKLILMKTDGELVLAEPDPTRFHPLASDQLFSSTTRALPALADGLLYVRDTRTLKCLDLRR
jgi:outer membrane protein assembly factor BamB